MHAIDEDLVLRLHSAWRRAAATSRGLMAEIVTAEQQVTHANARLGAVKMQVEIYQHGGRPDPGEHPEDYERRRSEAYQRRAEGEAQLRRNLRAAGAPIDPAHFAGAVGQVTTADFAAALGDAQRDLDRAEDNVRQLREEQGAAGSRAGSLRQTLQQSAVWLRANGFARLATEIEP
jgi:hypothetical protein